MKKPDLQCRSGFLLEWTKGQSQRSERQAAIGARHSEVMQPMSLQVPTVPMAHETTWSRKKRESAQV